MKRYRKERAWFQEDGSLPKELRQVRRTLQEGRSLMADADAPHCQLPGFWRKLR